MLKDKKWAKLNLIGYNYYMNNNFKILILIFGVIVLIIALFIGFKIYDSTQKISTVLDNFNLGISPTTNNISGTLVPNPNLKQAAWIPDWGSTAGLVSLEKVNANIQFAEVSPVWYEVNKNGSLIKKFPQNRAKLIKAIADEGSLLIPTIAMFDHELFTLVLNDKESFERHVQAILNEVSEQNYAGIDLDYESTKLADKELYFALLEALSKGLHATDKVLIVTVVAQWGDFVIYPSLPETRQVQDWQRIANYADTIRIMTYDFTSSKAAFPGPLAPSGWLEEVIKYALTKAPANKFSLGIPLYAYQWSWDAKLEDPPYITNFMLNHVADSTAKALTYREVLDVLKNNQGKKTEFEDEQIFTYTKAGRKYMLTYLDEKSIQVRNNLARKYGLSGVCYWRLGNEDKLLNLASVP